MHINTSLFGSAYLSVYVIYGFIYRYMILKLCINTCTKTYFCSDRSSELSRKLVLSMAGVKINPPEFKGRTYERYKQELLMWQSVTTLDAKKQAMVVVMFLPNDDTTHIKDKVLDNLTQAELADENGMKKTFRIFG